MELGRPPSNDLTTSPASSPCFSRLHFEWRSGSYLGCGATVYQGYRGAGNVGVHQRFGIRDHAARHDRAPLKLGMCWSNPRRLWCGSRCAQELDDGWITGTSGFALSRPPSTTLFPDGAQLDQLTKAQITKPSQAPIVPGLAPTHSPGARSGRGDGQSALEGLRSTIDSVWQLARRACFSRVLWRCARRTVAKSLVEAIPTDRIAFLRNCVSSTRQRLGSIFAVTTADNWKTPTATAASFLVGETNRH